MGNRFLSVFTYKTNKGIIKDMKYHDIRKHRIDFLYRLNRRASEVRKIIESFFYKPDYSIINCLDIGTADGLMLSKLNAFFKFNKAIGIDKSEELIKINRDTNIKLEIGDAENLHFKNGTFDIVIACAVIEFINNPNKMLSGCYRILKKEGLLIVTTRNPFLSKIADIIGYYKDKYNKPATIKNLIKILELNNFEVICLKYFMFFPFFKIPFEKQIEFFIRFIGFGKLMSNQLIVGKKCNLIL